ncbi:hypothetical protein [Hydrogenophaga sp.]|uniref:hypothetical protein n=1 Tax=Hydrogenophaga sp. TaxID=1904254 RepID=UPI00271F2A76|nr:hypothetical protein [Hydrogenophaga sp.]MDO9435029.1 hypothetical protein [Hydrogenophaga sp.]
MNELTAKIHHTDPAKVLPFLSLLADGTAASYYSRDTPRSFFMDMLLAGDHELFVATFDLYHELLSQAVKPGDAPYPRTLDLCVPADWNPPRAELDAVLRQARIERLNVQPRTFATEQGLVHQGVLPVACHCIATVLAAGATELAIGGSLADPDTIATAVAGSHLVSFTVTQSPAGALGTEDVEDYRTVVQALGSCATLKHLSFGESSLIALHPVIGGFQKGNGPKLESVSLGLSTHPTSRREIDITATNESDYRAFMKMVGQVPTLSVFRMRSVQLQGAQALASNILKPLAKSRSLTTLDFTGTIDVSTSPERLFADQKVAEFLVECPSLRHLNLDLGSPNVGGDSRWNWAGHHLDGHLQAHGELTHAQASQAFGDALASDTCELQTISLHGCHLSSAFCRNLFGSLARNTSIRELDLLGCYIPLAAKDELTAALAHNDTITLISVPRSLHMYHHIFKHLDGSIAIGFEASAPERLQMVLRHPRPLEAEAQRSLNKQIPAWQEKAKTFFHESRAKPLQNQQAALAQNRVHTPVANAHILMASAQDSPARHLHQQPLTGVLLALYQQAWTHIADQDVEALVKVLAQGAPVNVVDASTQKNALMMFASSTNNPALVHALLMHGAIDLGAGVQDGDPAPRVAAYLSAPPETNITTTANLTKTTTTTTTTTTASTANTTTMGVHRGGWINTMQ